MKRLKQALSLTLALVLSLALAVPAMAAGTTETFVDEKHGVTITMKGFLRKETHTYPANDLFIPVWLDGGGERYDSLTLTLYVLEDNSTVEIKASDGVKYAETDEEWSRWEDLCSEKEDFASYGYAWSDSVSFGISSDGKIGGEGGWADTPRPLDGPSTYTIRPDDEGKINVCYSAYLICESNFEKLTPIDGQPSAPAEPAEPATPAEPAAPATPAEPAEPAKPAEPAVVIPEGSVAYTVQKGDTLGFIATNFYGSNAQREALYQANIGAFRATRGALKPGMVLAIPAVLDKAVRIAAPAAGAGEKLYTVKAGDTLGQIAAAEYGNANEYKAIFERNSDRLKNANTIYEGQVIVLPAKK